MIARGPTVPRSARLMLEQRDLKKDLLALGLLALAVFLAAALLSYDPADPPSKLVYPHRAEVLNVCGRSGAFVSRYLFSRPGTGGLLPRVLAGRAGRHAPGPPAADPAASRGSCGWLISLAGLTTFVAMALPQLSPGPVIGAGGYLGAAGRGLLEMNFATVGAYILTVSLVLGGLLLSTDYLLVQIVGLCRRQAGPGHRARHAAGRGTMPGRRPNGSAASRTSTAMSPMKTRPPAGPRSSPSASRDGPAKRPSGRRGDAPATARQEGRSAGALPAAAPAAAESTGGGLASLLRIRKPKTAKKDEDLQLDEPPQNAADYELPSIELLLPSEIVQLRRARERGPPQGQDPGADLQGFRLQHPRGRDPDRPGDRPVRGRARGRAAAEQDHRPGRRPGDRPAGAQRPHRRAHPRQEHGRHRGAQHHAADRPPPRGDRRGQRQGPEDADPGLPRQGRVRATR